MKINIKDAKPEDVLLVLRKLIDEYDVELGEINLSIELKKDGERVDLYNKELREVGCGCDGAICSFSQNNVTLMRVSDVEEQRQRMTAFERSRGYRRATSGYIYLGKNADGLYRVFYMQRSPSENYYRSMVEGKERNGYEIVYSKKRCGVKNLKNRITESFKDKKIKDGKHFFLSLDDADIKKIIEICEEE